MWIFHFQELRRGKKLVTAGKIRVHVFANVGSWQILGWNRSEKNEDAPVGWPGHSAAPRLSTYFCHLASDSAVSPTSTRNQASRLYSSLANWPRESTIHDRVSRKDHFFHLQSNCRYKLKKFVFLAVNVSLCWNFSDPSPGLRLTPLILQQYVSILFNKILIILCGGY